MFSILRFSAKSSHECARIPLLSCLVFCGPFLQDKATGNVSLTLQPSVVLDGKGGEGGELSWGSESLKAGLKVKGTIAAVKDFGVFIQVHDSEVRGSTSKENKWKENITEFMPVQ